jgi:hypothetical protein
MATVTTFSQKAAAAALVALTMGAALTLQPGAAEARFNRNGWAAAGLIGGLAVGALVAGSARAHAQPGYYADPGYDVAPAPVYTTPAYYGGYAPQPAYDEEPVYRPRHHHRHYGRAPVSTEPTFAYRGPNCTLRRQTYFDGYAYRVQKVPVCD